MNKKEGYSVYIIGAVFIAAALLLIVLFRVIFPGEPAPLGKFSLSWSLTRGFIDFIILFPAIAFSGIVIPFGLQKSPGDRFSGFSSKFLDIIKGHIFFAIIASVAYGLFSLLAYPLLTDSRNNMKYEGQLFETSRGLAEEAAGNKDWREAARYAAICERIWPNSPRLEFLRDMIDLGLEELESIGTAEIRRELGIDPWDALGIPQAPATTDAAQALAMAEQAYNEGRYYDAHWLATIAERLSSAGSAEKRNIELFAANTWNKIAALEPGPDEITAYSNFRMKQDGYNAMVSGDWIRAYYIFQDLIALTPQDRELREFFALTKAGMEKTAFFLDEVNMDIGELRTWALFSLPARSGESPAGGRMVLRFEALSVFSDFSYGIGLEVISFNSSGDIAYRIEAPCVKLIPFNIDSGSGKNSSRIRQVILLMKVLDRNDSTVSMEPVWSGPERIDKSQIILNVSYDDFALLSRAGRGLEALSVPELFRGIQRFGAYGYIPQVFEAEILHRFSEPMVFLPMAILAIIIGWRFRAIKKPRYMIIPMIALLPVVFNGLAAFYRSVAHTLGVSLVLGLSFIPALLVFSAVNFVFFILVLIILAGQHG